MAKRESSELALLMLLAEQEKAGVQVPSQTLFPPVMNRQEPFAWFMEPGRGHLPAEIGGRIAEKKFLPAATENPDGITLTQDWDTLTEGDMTPLQYHPVTGNCTGSVFWDVSFR